MKSFEDLDCLYRVHLALPGAMNKTFAYILAFAPNPNRAEKMALKCFIPHTVYVIGAVPIWDIPDWLLEKDKDRVVAGDPKRRTYSEWDTRLKMLRKQRAEWCAQKAGQNPAGEE